MVVVEWWSRGRGLWWWWSGGVGEGSVVVVEWWSRGGVCGGGGVVE